MVARINLRFIVLMGVRVQVPAQVRLIYLFTFIFKNNAGCRMPDAQKRNKKSQIRIRSQMYAIGGAAIASHHPPPMLSAWFDRLAAI